jgi:hypothetical protein
MHTTKATLSGPAAPELTSRVTCTGDVSDVMFCDVISSLVSGTSTETHVLSLAVLTSLDKVAVMR